HRSVNHAGRKKRWPILAGKTISRGRKTRTRKKKLRPAVTASAYRFMAAALSSEAWTGEGLPRRRGRFGSGTRPSALLVGRGRDDHRRGEVFGPTHDGCRRLLLGLAGIDENLPRFGAVEQARFVGCRDGLGRRTVRRISRSSAGSDHPV